MAKLPECSEYLSAIETPQLFKSPVLMGGHVVKRNDTVIRYAGGFCVVFPFENLNRKYAIRCWHASVDDAQKRTKEIADELRRLQLPYFVGFEYFSDGILTNEGVQPIVAMDWVDASPLKDYISKYLYSPEKLKTLADNFLKMAKSLHEHGISHGDLQHGNIMVKDSGELVLVDYDSMYVPSLNGYSDDIKGLEGYQHPARWQNKKLTPKADYFSELVIYISILALSKIPSLWNDLGIEDTDTLLFNSDDIASRGSSNIFKVLETDSELKNLSQSLKDALLQISIEDLNPLEEIVGSPIDSISSKWVNNGYTPPSEPDYKKGAEDMSSKWKQNVRISETPNIDNINKKW